MKPWINNLDQCKNIQITQDFKGTDYGTTRVLTEAIVNSQLCMSGCSNKVYIWLNQGSMPGNPAHRKRVLKKVSTQPMKILTFWNLP
jgi:hypothetical protein